MLVNINDNSGRKADSEMFLKTFDMLTVTENSNAGPVLYPVAKKKIIKKSAQCQRQETIIK